MRWFATSQAPAPTGRRPAPATRREITDVIRAAFIDSLKGFATTDARILIQRIEYAGDAERIWYLRPEAMSVLASLHGEVRARETLARIDSLFRDVLPDGLASKLRAAPAAHGATTIRRPQPLKETA